MKFNDEISNKTIYVDLDSLFDTRFSTLLNYLDKDSLSKILKDEYYDKRIVDEFPMIPNDIFKILYSTRNIKQLKTAYPTRVTGLILYDLSTIRLTSNVSKPIRLLINIYPYRLSDNDYNILKKIIRKFIPSYSYFIEFINVSLSKLNPSNLSNNLYSMYKYDGLTWLNYFITTSKGLDTSLVETKFHIPALLDRIVYLDNKKDYLELFRNLEDSYKPIIDLIVEPIEAFNLIK